MLFYALALKEEAAVGNQQSVTLKSKLQGIPKIVY